MGTTKSNGVMTTAIALESPGSGLGTAAYVSEKLGWPTFFTVSTAAEIPGLVMLVWRFGRWSNLKI